MMTWTYRRPGSFRIFFIAFLLSLARILSLSNSYQRRPGSMGDQLMQKQSGISGDGQSATSSSCPCCCFLPDGSTFLPPNLLPENFEMDSRENNEVNAVESFREISAAFQELSNNNVDSKDTSLVLLVDTHGHAHLDQDRHESYIDDLEETFSIPIVSLSCAVEERDWKDVLEYASQLDSILPGLGVHPWYLANLSDSWLSDLEKLLLKHPAAIVGEIGLCKMARFVRTHVDGKQAALLLQRQVFKDQMCLAGKLQRPVSVHCVKQHGVFMKVLSELIEEGKPFPTAIGMHSFTGTAHHVKDIIKFEELHFPERRFFYFGFSHIVNYEMCSSEKSRRQGREAVCAVPLDRLMAESDVHSARDVAVATAGSVAYIAKALEKPISEVAQFTAVNGLAFLKLTSHQHKN